MLKMTYKWSLNDKVFFSLLMLCVLGIIWILILVIFPPIFGILYGISVCIAYILHTLKLFIVKRKG